MSGSKSGIDSLGSSKTKSCDVGSCTAHKSACIEMLTSATATGVWVDDVAHKTVEKCVYKYESQKVSFSPWVEFPVYSYPPPGNMKGLRWHVTSSLTATKY